MINKGYLTAKTDKESDEVYTPEYAVKPILEYIDKGNKKSYTIWCPFDKEDSNFVKLIREEGYKVICSHIDNGKNFFYYEPEESYDYIISNPPFSIKDDIIKRLYELDKPYAVLMPLNVLQGQKRFNYLKDINGKKEIQKGVSFASIYLCRKFLPKDLIMKELNIY